ncbi:hypothetical protein CKJ90_29755, partial [Klebsiella pneumoniae]
STASQHLGAPPFAFEGKGAAGGHSATHKATAEPNSPTARLSKPVVVAVIAMPRANDPCASSGLCPGSTASQHLGAPPFAFEGKGAAGGHSATHKATAE